MEDGGGQLLVDRQRRTALFVTPEPVDSDVVVHPLLAGVGAVFAHWAGRTTLHGGAFLSEGGRTWAIVGPSEAGKSTFLAHLATLGRPVLADDLVVVQGRVAFAGPRSVDLRKEAAERLGAERYAGTARMATRWRVPLPPIDAELPLDGFVSLRWSEEVTVEKLRPAERIRGLTPWLDCDPEALMELASLPMLELRRPRRWEALDAAAQRLLDALSG
jgi:hypothetical protein